MDLKDLKTQATITDINQFVDALLKVYGTEFALKINPAQIPVLISEGMAIMEGFKNLTGGQRKSILLIFLERIILASPLPEQQKGICKMLIETGSVSATIDIISYVAKGLSSINKQDCIKCCPCWSR